MKQSIQKILMSCFVGVLIIYPPLTAIAEPLQHPDDEINEEVLEDEETPMNPIEDADEENINDGTSENEVDEEEINPALEKLNELATYQAQREFVEKKVKELKNDLSEENIIFTLDLIVHLPLPKDQQYIGDRTNFLLEAREVLYKSYNSSVIDIDQYNEYFYYFAENAIDRFIETKEYYDYQLANYSLNMIYDTGERFDDLYNKLQEHEKYAQGGVVIEDTFPDFSNNKEMENTVLPHQDEWKNNLKPGVSVSDLPSNQPKIKYPEFQVGKFPYQNRTSSTVPTGNAFNSLWDYYLSYIPPENSYNSHYGLEQNQLNVAEDGTILSTITIQYTFDKDSDSPYYYDTGIFIGEDGTISYQNARDALYQLTIQSKNKFVEDKNRALSLIDGYIILVEDENKRFPVSEFIEMFEKTSIGVKALDTRSGNTLQLAELVEYNRLSSVYIDDQEVILETKPIVDNSIVLFPIEKIAKALGGTVITDENKTTVSYQGNKVVFTDGSSMVLSNGESIDVKVTTRKTKDGIRVAQIDPMLDMFGMKIEVEAESYEVNVVNK